jgi:hypothetical protein
MSQRPQLGQHSLKTAWEWVTRGINAEELPPPSAIGMSTARNVTTSAATMPTKVEK